MIISICRFGSQSAGAHSVKRSVKLTNNSSSGTCSVVYMYNVCVYQ